MIGSSTLTVKDGNSYRVHIIGGIILEDIPIDKLIEVDTKYKKKPEAVLTDEKDVFKILSSTNCISPNVEGYSQFAGDGHWFIDLSTQSFIDTKEFVNNHRQRFAAELEAERLAQDKIIKAKTRKLLRKANSDAKIFCKELLAFIEGKSKQPYKVESYAKENREYDSQEYQIGNFRVSRHRRSSDVMFFAPGHSEDYELIRKKFNFTPIFFKYLKANGWKVTVFNYFEGKRKWIGQWHAEKNGKTMMWHRLMEHDIRLVKVKTI